MKQNIQIPSYVTQVTETLQRGGFEAFLVGGCVRDMILGREPKDWDVTTDATPEQIQGLFEKTVYENTFGTVMVMIPKENELSLLPDVGVSRENVTRETPLAGDRNPGVSHETVSYETVEVTPYRTEADYNDNRHPDKVAFSDNIEDDLKRRDFTINALAYDPSLNDTSTGSVPTASIKDMFGGLKDSSTLLTAGINDSSTPHSTSSGQALSAGKVIDLYGGLQDIENKVIRTVGNPDERFQEDALRMLRAIRFSAELGHQNFSDGKISGGQGFAVSHETLESILKNKDLLARISQERIRDEFVKIIMSPEPMAGIGMLLKLGLNKYIVPELEEGVGCEQKGEHIYDVFEHILHALGHAADKRQPLHIRLAALFHDIGKPRTRRWDGTKAGGAGKYTFYGHEVVGARMVVKIMDRLKFPKDISEMVTKLVRYHMFFSDTEQITLSAVRRTIVNVGRENIWDLMQVRECDRVGMKKKEAPYRLRKYHAMIEEALRAPTSVGMLKINGKVLIKELGIKPGPRMGWILHALLEECLEEPAPQSLGDVGKNNLEYLKTRVLELDKLSDKDLRAMGEKAKLAKDEVEQEELEEIRKKHGVK